MSLLGQSRRFVQATSTSASPSIPDVFRRRSERSKRANSGHDAVGNARITDATPEGVVSTGMGWWRPGSITPGNGAFDVNLNAAMTYDGPWDPISSSVDSREIRCRILPV
jgi:hypothetical protein